jgi:hypothetical protein
VSNVADLLRVGDAVFVDSFEGFGGPARVVETRAHPHTRCKVAMADGSQPPFWAHDFELSPRPEDGPAYDSRPDTLAHVGEVRALLGNVVAELGRRAEAHDRSKLEDPEKAAFDEFTPKLRHSTYGSDEYRGFLAAMGPALQHHYAHNSHHPEHYPDGVRGMDLLDLVEMLCDWKAATLRHADGDLLRSIEINQGRFGYGDELKRILTNTAARLGLLATAPSKGGA